jgi:hypothetical protein
MNLFWKKLIGGITPTTKLEKDEVDLVKAMHRYAEVSKSVELAEYKKLFHVVKSAKFQENKKILQNRKYKDTEEYQVSRKYNKLVDSIAIQTYYKVLDSEELKQYLAFKLTPEYELLGDKKKVKTTLSLRKLKTFEHSKAFKTYMRFHESYILTEFDKLKIKVASPEFTKANEFWMNQKRWQTTPEYVQEQRFYELAKNPDVDFYINEKPERFEKYKKLVITFNDEFEWNSLDKSHWAFGFHYNNEKLIEDHSFTNEKQANNQGKNVTVENGILKIATKHEKVTARAWDTEKGFILRKFNYTSDVLQTADKFRQKFGIYRAKIRCTGAFHHAFWLGSDKKLPLINIFHYDGKNITVGNSNKDIVDGVKIKGLNPSEYFIYTLIWTQKELIWMINNIEVYRTVSSVPKEAMYLGFNSFISEKQHGSTGHLEVDWVRVYTN